MFAYLLGILDVVRCSCICFGYLTCTDNHLFVVDIWLVQMFMNLLCILDIFRCSCICCGYWTLAYFRALVVDMGQYRCSRICCGCLTWADIRVCIVDIELIQTFVYLMWILEIADFCVFVVYVWHGHYFCVFVVDTRQLSIITLLSYPIKSYSKTNIDNWKGSVTFVKVSNIDQCLTNLRLILQIDKYLTSGQHII